jgi:drug/metabolite transporter (DMT)-like permease
MLLLSRQPLPWHSKARQTYFAIAVQVYGAMMAVYWGAQFIPSGWVSVIFGLSPFITALLTALWLEERSLTWDKLLAYLLGVGGLALIFSTAIQILHLIASGVVDQSKTIKIKAKAIRILN